VSDSSLARARLVSGTGRVWFGRARRLTVWLSHDIHLFDEARPLRSLRSSSLRLPPHFQGRRQSGRAPGLGRTGRHRPSPSLRGLHGSRARSSSGSCAFRCSQGEAARSRPRASPSPSCRRSAPSGPSTRAARSPGSIRGQLGSPRTCRRGRPRRTTSGPEPGRSGRSTTRQARSSASMRSRAR
jgi:hypothetical protein